MLDNNHSVNILLQESYNINYPSDIILTECFSETCTGYGTYNSDFLYIFKEKLEEIIKSEYKNPYNTDSYYPFDIKLFVDVLDPEYKNITDFSEFLTDNHNLKTNFRYTCGKTYNIIPHKKNYIVLFIRFILVTAAFTYHNEYHYSYSDISLDMYLDYARSIINHELYHYKQYMHTISTYGREFTIYMYDKNLHTDYKLSKLEEEAFKVSHNTLLQYSIYQESYIQKEQQLIDFKTFFDPYYKEFLDRKSTSVLSKNFYILLYNDTVRIIKNNKNKLDVLVEYINDFLNDKMKIKKNMLLMLNNKQYRPRLYMDQDIINVLNHAIELSIIYKNLGYQLSTKDNDLEYLKERCNFVGTNKEFIIKSMRDFHKERNRLK